MAFSNGLFAQMTFEAYAPVKKVMQGEYFEVSYTLRNADGINFRPPDFSNFRVVQGPSRSVSTSIINGNRSSELTHSYLLEAKEPGTYKINYATIKVGNELVRSNTLSISVTERDMKSLEEIATDANIFVRAIPSTTTAYPGQQILIDYKLYSSVSIDHYSVAAESDYQGFFAQPLRRFRGRTQQEEIGGKTYSTLVFRRVAAFPQVIDTLEISPLRLQVGLSPEGGRDRFNPFGSPMKVSSVSSDPVQIAVNPLPAGSPPSFCGGIGTFEMRTSYDRNTLTTDDALTILLTLSGNGDVKRLEAPIWMENDSFEVYPPSVIDENVFENQGEIIAQKTFEYQLLPLYPGEYDIQPEVAIFNPDSTKFTTLKGTTISLQVSQGSGKRRNIVQEETNDGEALEMRPFRTDASVYQKEKVFLNTTGFWLATLPAPFLLLIAWGMRQMRARRANIDPAELRRSKAAKVAAERLKQAKSYLDQGENRSFFDEVSKASLGFLIDRIGIPPADLKKEVIRQSLEANDVEPDLTDRLLALLQKCEYALFAGQADQSAKEDVYQEAFDVITQLAKKVV